MTSVMDREAGSAGQPEFSAEQEPGSVLNRVVNSAGVVVEEVTIEHLQDDGADFAYHTGEVVEEEA